MFKYTYIHAHIEINEHTYIIHAHIKIHICLWI